MEVEMVLKRIKTAESLRVFASVVVQILVATDEVLVVESILWSCPVHTDKFLTCRDICENAFLDVLITVEVNSLFCDVAVTRTALAVCSQAAYSLHGAQLGDHGFRLLTGRLFALLGVDRLEHFCHNFVP